MKQKIKVIQIAHASHSYFAEKKDDDLKKIILNDWYTKTAKQVKKFHPEIDVECWAPEKWNDREEQFLEQGIKFRIFPVTFSPLYALDFSIPMLQELRKEIRKSEKEGHKLVIHLHEYHNLHGLVIASWFNKNKIIGQHHGGSWPIKHLMQTKRYKFVFPLFLLGQVWENKVLKNINSFFVLSKDEIDYLKRVAPESSIKFQTMGIEDEYFEKVDKKMARKKLGLPLDKKIVIFLGRINQVKGVGYLIEAMKELKDVELRIMGFGPQEEEYRKYVKKNNLKNIKFLGGVFGEKKMLYLSAGDVLVLPSSKEGAPVSVMEAMARNLPSVVSDVGGVELMIKNNINGIMIRPRQSEDIVNAVRSVLKWKEKDIRSYAKQYRWKEIIDNTVKEYQK